MDGKQEGWEKTLLTNCMRSLKNSQCLQYLGIAPVCAKQVKRMKFSECCEIDHENLVTKDMDRLPPLPFIPQRVNY